VNFSQFLAAVHISIATKWLEIEQVNLHADFSSPSASHP